MKTTFIGRSEAMREHLLFLDLVDDDAAIAAYEAHHTPGAVWPEVVESITASGIREMRIYRFGARLAMLIRVSDDFDFATKGVADADNPVVARWEALMDGFQRTLPGTAPGTKWQVAARIFDLAAHDKSVEPG